MKQGAAIKVSRDAQRNRLIGDCMSYPDSDGLLKSKFIIACAIAFSICWVSIGFPFAAPIDLHSYSSLAPFHVSEIQLLPITNSNYFHCLPIYSEWFIITKECQSQQYKQTDNSALLSGLAIIRLPVI